MAEICDVDKFPSGFPFAVESEICERILTSFGFGGTFVEQGLKL